MFPRLKTNDTFSYVSRRVRFSRSLSLSIYLSISLSLSLHISPPPLYLSRTLNITPVLAQQWALWSKPIWYLRCWHSFSWHPIAFCFSFKYESGFRYGMFWHKNGSTSTISTTSCRLKHCCTRRVNDGNVLATCRKLTLSPNVGRNLIVGSTYVMNCRSQPTSQTLLSAAHMWWIAEVSQRAKPYCRQLIICDELQKSANEPNRIVGSTYVMNCRSQPTSQTLLSAAHNMWWIAEVSQRATHWIKPHMKCLNQKSANESLTGLNHTWSVWIRSQPTSHSLD